MAKKVTPQAIYEVYREKIHKDEQEGRLPDGWPLPPTTWEEVSEYHRQLFTQMAFKMNCITSEFSVE